ncbi:4,5-DOPA dioxygenase extradiol [Pseudomonas sp. BIGb0408]|uniref:4,5-DOPA dioxygenase extradiol n=1 Tax=Phytopseudomonas flavescens TaxID=29435 RepID=A0A7Z0BPQ7_9GAMM|nr:MULTISPECIES: class III extradiol ring-cleavage dioxygenase [Pseudomonas]MCW2293077.1 4,5-DOPA dioxygenase extradiol [Pseudomonas sp. BIGb0408]NYH72353.1 4,5-DOPA dioxygenase extradiol [Pseudomonas flavescens]
MLPSLFISHGSPMLALQPGASGVALSRLAGELPKPRAIVVVSAHWESAELLVMSAAQPQTWHDFGGFPPELYQVQYPAPGNPQLAEDILQRLKTAGLPARADERRPFDHGSWVPLSLMYPQADIPVVQVSLPSHKGAALQVQVGEALAGLREQNVLLLGSGSITHNLGELDWRAAPEEATPWAAEFRDWVVDKLQRDDLQALLDYRQQAPHARRNHPSEEHLLPLFFARGAGGTCQIEHQGFTLGALGMDIYSFA